MTPAEQKKVNAVTAALTETFFVGQRVVIPSWNNDTGTVRKVLRHSLDIHLDDAKRISRINRNIVKPLP